MSTFCFNVVEEVLPLTRKAKVFTRPSAPVVQPARATTSPSVPVLAQTLPTAHFDAVVENRLARVPVRPAAGSPDFSGHSVVWVPGSIPRSTIRASCRALSRSARDRPDPS